MCTVQLQKRARITVQLRRNVEMLNIIPALHIYSIVSLKVLACSSIKLFIFIWTEMMDKSVLRHFFGLRKKE